MAKRMTAIALIYLAATFAWMVLGGSVQHRTWQTDSRLQGEVSGLWGTEQTQLSPELVFIHKVRETRTEKVEDLETKTTKVVTRESWVAKSVPVILTGSEIDVSLDLDQRKKGLLWYSTYGIGFDGTYTYVHEDDREGELNITYRFPTTVASYDDFRFEVGGVPEPRLEPVTANGARFLRETVPVKRGTRVSFRIAYRSRGLDWWRYSFGSDVNRVRDFRMAMATDFREIDFPQGTISPTSRTATSDGWLLEWSFENLISGFQIGMEAPRRINPGPLAARASYFAPVSLGFFFVWMFVITVIKKIDLHPMNYLFLAAGFFAFNLLFSYTADHIDVAVAFTLASAVSVFLVVSYLRLVVGLRFAAVEAGISQLIYLVLFSYAHFLEGYTGLVVTIASILTLFALMQLTAKLDWNAVFRRAGAGASASGELPSGG